MHQKIGILGGLSPESTVSYYLHITRSYVERFGDYGYPEILIYSVNLENYHRWRSADRWDLITEDLIAVANGLRRAGADFGLIATNTMHKVFEAVQAGVDMPLIHIMDATVAAIVEKGLATVGLLGTRYTMGERFYRQRLEASGLEVLVPAEEDQEIVHRIIVDELVRGQMLEDSRRQYLEVIARLQGRGAQGIILGCTEIPLLVRQSDCAIPLFDTARLHAEAALQRAIVPGCTC